MRSSTFRALRFNDGAAGSPEPGGRRPRARPAGALAATALACALALLWAPEARAQGAPEPSVTELDALRIRFRKGIALQAANNCTAALTEYWAVAKVKMTPQVAFNIAECEERLGKLNSALGNYRVAASRAAVDPSKASEVNAQVGARIEALEARIPKLTLLREKGSETASVQVDGTDVGSSTSDVAVDPGMHVVVAKVGDKIVFRETVRLEEKDAKKLTVRAGVALSPIAPGAEQPEAQPKSNRRAVGVTIGALGMASAVVGGVFMGLRGSTLTQLAGVCQNSRCPADAQAISDRGKTDTGVAEVTLGLGVIGIVTGVVLFATAPKAQKPDSEPRAASGLSLVASAPGASLAGASLLGTF